MVVNLEFIKAIVTAEEVLLLDPLSHEVLPFVDQLRQQFLVRSTYQNHLLGVEENETPFCAGDKWPCTPEAAESLESELPFEFQVLEIALEVVCTYLDSNVSDLEKEAYPILDELARNVSTKNLERVRSLKSNLTRILARVQKVTYFLLFCFQLLWSSHMHSPMVLNSASDALPNSGLTFPSKWNIIIVFITLYVP